MSIETINTPGAGVVAVNIQNRGVKVIPEMLMSLLKKVGNVVGTIFSSTGRGIFNTPGFLYRNAVPAIKICCVLGAISVLAKAYNRKKESEKDEIKKLLVLLIGLVIMASYLEVKMPEPTHRIVYQVKV